MKRVSILLMLCCLLTPVARGAAAPCKLHDFQQEFNAVVSSVQPSVVAVIAYSGVSPDGESQNGGLTSLKKTVGSGIVIDSSEGSGFILTTHSVVGHERTVFIRTHDDKLHQAVRIGADPRSDLALLAVRGLEQTPVRLGRSADLEPGTWLITVGQGEGVYPNCSFGAFATMASSPLPAIPGGLIEMTAHVFPGQTGGAVVNLAGEVVGILLGPMSEGDGPESNVSGEPAPIFGLMTDLSVAIPIDVARRVAGELEQHGTASPAFLGVSVQMPADALRKILPIRDDIGVLIESVVAGGPAADAAIEPGDIIEVFDNQPVHDPGELARLVSEHRPGDRCIVELLRGDIHLRRAVTLDPQPASFVPAQSGGR